MESAGRILIIVQNLPVPFDRRVWLEATTLTKEGYKVSVISPRTKNDLKFEELERVKIYRYYVPADAQGLPGYIFEFAYCWLMILYLTIKVAINDGFDVIQACNPPETFFMIGLLFKLFGKKFVFDHHDLSPEMYLAKYGNRRGLLYRVLLLLEKCTFKTADLVITTNESHREIALKRGKVDENKIYIVRSGPDFDRLTLLPPEPALKEGRKHLVCYLGEMCPQDGVDLLLKSIKYFNETLNQEDVMFVLMGGGSALPVLQDLKEELNINGNVRFTGRVSDKDLCRYLSTADLCVDPDPYSEWADKSTMNKIMEYMAFGKAVVAYDLKEGRYSAQHAAEYVIPNDEMRFAKTMLRLLKDEKKRNKMGQYGRERVEKELSWDHTKRNLIQAYADLFK